jgi:hypothetical protein
MKRCWLLLAALWLEFYRTKKLYIFSAIDIRTAVTKTAITVGEFHREFTIGC